MWTAASALSRGYLLHVNKSPDSARPTQDIEFRRWQHRDRTADRKRSNTTLLWVDVNWQIIKVAH